MLTISPDLAQAFETATLHRWRADISAELRRNHPDAAARFPGAKLESWVQDAMDTLSRQGPAKWPDHRLFATTLFAVTEAEPDEVATGDLIAILVSPASFAARMKLLHKAFGSTGA